MLGPGSDAFHYDHFHIDLARHDPRGERRICKPILKFAPRIDPERSREVLQSAASSADLAPVDLEQDVPEETPISARAAATAVAVLRCPGPGPALFRAEGYADLPGAHAGSSARRPRPIRRRPPAGQASRRADLRASRLGAPSAGQPGSTGARSIKRKRCLDLGVASLTWSKMRATNLLEHSR